MSFYDIYLISKQLSAKTDLEHHPPPLRHPLPIPSGFISTSINKPAWYRSVVQTVAEENKMYFSKKTPAYYRETPKKVSLIGL